MCSVDGARVKAMASNLHPQPRPWGFRVLSSFKISEQLHNCTISTSTTVTKTGGGECRQRPQICIPNPDPGGSLSSKFLNNSTTARSLPLPPPRRLQDRRRQGVQRWRRARVGNGLKLRPSTEERYAQHATTQQLAIVSPVSRRSAGTENNFRYCPDRKLNLF